MWKVPYGFCAYCSQRRRLVVGFYELWFEPQGDLVNERNPPMCVLHVLCEECTGYARSNLEDGMKLLLCRGLQS